MQVLRQRSLGPSNPEVGVGLLVQAAHLSLPPEKFGIGSVSIIGCVGSSARSGSGNGGSSAQGDTARRTNTTPNYLPSRAYSRMTAASTATSTSTTTTTASSTATATLP